MPQFKMGRRIPKVRGPRFKFRDYLRKGLPQPPPTSDYSAKAAKAIGNVYLNDQLGDCVIAGMGHLVGIFTGNATGTPVIFTDAQITAEYSAIGGYQPGNESTDQGCDEETALNYWQNTGIGGGHKILGWLEVDATDVNQVKSSQWLFENLFFGVSMPNKWVNPMPESAGFTWDVAGRPVQGNGHCVVGCGHNATGIDICTWGMVGTMTYKAVATYARQQAGGNLYVVVTEELADSASGKAASGFDMGQLVDDFNSMGGHVDAPQQDPVNWDVIYGAAQ
jgi:hypothetical protein